MATKAVFVTVGTTEFDALVKCVSSVDIRKILQMLGYSKVVVQIGRGDYEPMDKEPIAGLELEWFRYKDSIREEIDNASLVISHAGAGSVLEALGADKPLIVVINEDLQENHQLELANQLYIDGHLVYCNCKNLGHTLETEDLGKLKPFRSAKPEIFKRFVDSVMGFS